MSESMLAIEGDEELRILLGNLDAFFGARALGRAYSRGADQGDGNYEHYVQSDRWQADIHKGRWQTTADVAGVMAPTAAALVYTAIDVIIAGGRAWRPYIRQMTKLLKRAMQEYPAPPAGSTYVRTGTLQQSWDEEVLV